MSKGPTKLNCIGERAVTYDLPPEHRWAVVLAGGDGKRVLGLSRMIAGDSRPKQFCRFFGNKSLLAHTQERIAPLFRPDRTLFVLSRRHESYYREEFKNAEDRCLLAQPANRGTAAAVMLSLQTVLRRDEDAVVAFFPSDHHYLDPTAFRATVDRALTLAEEYPHSVMLIGADASYPEVEYGWIEPGRALVDSPINPLHRVSRFWEKPALEKAIRLQTRGCLWNTFVMIGLATAFFELILTTQPQLLRRFEPIRCNHDLDRVYDSVDPVDFSQGVLSNVPQRLMVLGDGMSGWSDLGSPRRVLNTMAGYEFEWWNETLRTGDCFPWRTGAAQLPGTGRTRPTMHVSKARRFAGLCRFV